jgi:hypothetical protein
LASAILLSLFTVSDLFITHYALLHPVAIAIAGIVLGAFFEDWRLPLSQLGNFSTVYPRALVFIIVIVWLLGDGLATVGYHRDLTRSGGLSDHSDATYHLAYHLRYNGLGAPIVLDWGLDAPVRYLSEGTVQPIEIFGYDSPDRPDEAFTLRLAPFLENPDNVYLLRAPGQSVFQGRREIFFEQVDQVGREAILERSFTQRDGLHLFELWRIRP